MILECVCGKWHNASPTAMALVMHSYAAGELHKVGKTGVLPLCFLNAFTEDNLTEFRRRYAKNDINVDNKPAVVVKP